MGIPSTVRSSPSAMAFNWSRVICWPVMAENESAIALPTFVWARYSGGRFLSSSVNSAAGIPKSLRFIVPVISPAMPVISAHDIAI